MTGWVILLSPFDVSRRVGGEREQREVRAGDGQILMLTQGRTNYGPGNHMQPITLFNLNNPNNKSIIK